ncbi:MAG: septum formation inhibitor Maf [Hyphomicrobiales bacterium]|nr:Maf-like protein [Hyphomicrobiales bacterium]PCH51127.1 MAG: septum formation inhibitor Maf [Hyphomicrobiales bacterium]PCH51403.1 MAG: septum formation inhibitor Maf [Hyphomicrobiales bacterium]
MPNKNQIILASKSKYRAILLKNAGIQFTQQAAHIDERAIEEPLLEAEMNAADIAEILALAKATKVSDRNENTLVIGTDQTLSFEGSLLHKPQDMEEARKRLLAFSGKSHELNSAIAIVKNGEVLWSFVDKSVITFRELTPKFIGQHLASVGDEVLSSVGAYQIEGKGVQLFENIEGDFFSIMGLPLLPLLAQLRIINKENIESRNN